MTKPSNNTPTSLYAVAIEHQKKLCPLEQPSPNMAMALAANLDDKQLVGVFSMQTHRGVVLIEHNDPDALAALCSKITPHHLPPQVHLVSPESALQYFYRNPQILEQAENGARYVLLMLAALLFPDKDFEATVFGKLPTLSLRDLPAYLRQNALQPAHA